MRIIDPSIIRWYNNDWQNLPSVTSILKLAPVPIFIQSWQDRIWLEAYKEHMEKLATRGTAIHKVCENFFLKTNHPIPTDFELQHFITWFYTFVSKFGANITAPSCGYKIEETIKSNEFWYAGTIDLICKMFWQTTLIDWKTSSSSKLWWEMSEVYWMQGVAYAMLWNYLNPYNQIEQVFIVILTNNRKDWLWETKLILRSEFPVYFSQFLPYLLFMNTVHNEGFMPNISLLEKLNGSTISSN